MTFYLHLIEDEDKYISEIKSIIQQISTDVVLTVSKSRASALQHIGKEFSDLVVLDLKIPTIDNALDASPVHGHAIFTKIRAESPGTPILVLTGSSIEDFASTMLAEAQKIDIWGENQKISTVSLLQKYKFQQLKGILEAAILSVNSLNSIELTRNGLNLDTEEDRLIRIFSRKYNGTRAVISQLNGGLSGARVLRIKVTNNHGVRAKHAIAKLGTRTSINDEARRFEQHVSSLDAGVTPRYLCALEHGAGKLSSVFYSLEDGYDFTAFETITMELPSAEIVIKNTEAGLKNWTQGVPETRKLIREIRQSVMSDTDFADIKTRYNLVWADEFENRAVQTRWGCIHGDLHGSNILANLEGAIEIIDYGDVGEGPLALDPVTLELSLLFHPLSPLRDGILPTAEQSNNWGNLEIFTKDAPRPAMFKACRAWAVRVGVGDRDIAACAYVYLIRQLKYEDTNKELILGLLDGVRNLYDAT